MDSSDLEKDSDLEEDSVWDEDDDLEKDSDLEHESDVEEDELEKDSDLEDDEIEAATNFEPQVNGELIPHPHLHGGEHIPPAFVQYFRDFLSGDGQNVLMMEKPSPGWWSNCTSKFKNFELGQCRRRDIDSEFLNHQNSLDPVDVQDDEGHIQHLEKKLMTVNGEMHSRRVAQASIEWLIFSLTFTKFFSGGCW